MAKRSEPGMSRRRRGQALVELVLVTMTLMLLAAGTFDLGRAWYGSISITSAAREGALEAAIDPGSFQAGQACDSTTNRIICRVIGAAAGSNVTIAPADISVTCDPSPCPTTPTFGDTVTVTVTSHFGVITPFLSVISGPSLTLRASATAQLIVAP